MIDKNFNASASKEEKLLQAEENRARLKKIEQISDQKLRERLYEQIKANERTLQEEKLKASQLEEKTVQESIKRNIAAKHQLHLKPKYGFVPFPRKQEGQIRINIRRSVGADLDKKLNRLRSSLNRDLDETINQAHSATQENRGEKRSLFTKSAEKKTEKKEATSMDKTTTRSRLRRR